MTVGNSGSCQWCGGRGWKLLTLRRSQELPGSTPERAPVQRTRVTCIACLGTGNPQAA